MLVCLAFGGVSAAESLYTWKDARGVTHITETPPPDNARAQEVIEYKPRTAGELNAIEAQKKAFRKRLETKAANQKAMNARRNARETREQAVAAEAEAEAAQKRAEEFAEKVGTNWRRYQRNKATILRLESEAEAARRKAQSAKESAQSTAETAADAEERTASPENRDSFSAAGDMKSR